MSLRGRLSRILLMHAAAVAWVACFAPEDPTAEERGAAAVVGSWAGQVEGAALLLQLDIHPGGSYLVGIFAGEDLVERETGRWTAARGRLRTDPATCETADQAGGPLHLVACTGPDSVAIAITGNTWPLHFTAAGELVTVTLKRL